MKKTISLFLLIIIVSSFTSCTMVADIVNPELEIKYMKLMEMIQFLDVEDGYSFMTYIPHHFRNIEYLLDEFPLFYRDIAEIKKECATLEIYFKALFNRNNSYAERHSIAMQLLATDDFHGWDLERAIFHYMSDPNILSVVLFGEWGSSNTLGFFEKSDNDIWFYTNLPTGKQDGIDYFFFIENRVIGYYPKNDENSKINSFRIIDIDYNKVKIYCFADNNYYTLENRSK